MKFWDFVTNQAPAPDDPEKTIEERVLTLDGPIGAESWFDDDVTPALFKDELNAGTGDITVWINYPGGDCFAAAQIYNMLRDYKGRVTVKIDGIAASAASVIAMAGDQVLVSPVSMLMIHNQSTVAMWDHNDMQKAAEMLESVKDSIINAYAVKTGLSRNKLSQLMEDETWMDAKMAVELHFADAMIERTKNEGTGAAPKGTLFKSRRMDEAVTNKVIDHYKKPPVETPENTRKASDCYERLNLLKTMM